MYLFLNLHPESNLLVIGFERRVFFGAIMWASSNNTCVLGSIRPEIPSSKLVFLSVAVKPRNIPYVCIFFSWFTYLFDLSLCVNTRDPKFRSFLISAFLLLSSLYGIVFIDEWGIQCLTNTAWCKVNDQYSGPTYEEYKRQRIICSSILFGLSSIPFWKDVSLRVTSRLSLECFSYATAYI